MSSVTRQLVEELREKLGETPPLAPPRPARPLPEPPRRLFPGKCVSAERLRGQASLRPVPGAPPQLIPPEIEGQSAFAKEAAKHTTALIGIGHVGTRYATDVVLQFQAELAVAHDAVSRVLPEGWAESQGLLSLKSRVTDHHEFLLRPDLGRRLDEPSLALLRAQAQTDIDVQPILADGLSAVACLGSGVDLLTAFSAECEALGLSVGTPMLAQYARVWLEDEIGQEVRAKVAVILLGERPGLGTGDGLSAYLVHGPRLGKTDGDRNMMSNIHDRGTKPAEAARRLAVLSRSMIAQGNSGVDLDLSGLADELFEAAGRELRAPQKRERLVEVER